jgi:hypothetical protein
MSDFTESQKRALAIAPKIVAVIGMVGDLIIITEILVLDRPNKLKRTIHRILLVMSICDLIPTFGWFLSTWPIPKEEDGLFYNAGNETTCVVQGFMNQWSISVPLLNMCLAIYYLLVIQYSWTEKQIRKKVEPLFYGLSLSVAIGTCSASVALDLFNNANIWCWIAPMPLDCNQSYNNNGETDCIRGNNATLYQWVFYYVIVWFALLFVTVIMFKVYLSFRKLETANARYATAMSSHGGRNKASRARQVGTQGICYVGAMYVTFFFPTVNRAVQAFAGVTSFPLLFLAVISFPIQGFCNFLVYIRPRFIKYRSDHPGTTVGGTLKAILYDQYKANISRDNIQYTTETAPGPTTSDGAHESDKQQDHVEEAAEDEQE